MDALKKTAALRVQRQTDGMPPGSVRSLSLSGVPLMPELLIPLTGLTRLTLVCMKPKMQSLTELPLDRWPQLCTLELSDNAISLPGGGGSGSGSAALPPCPQVKRLLLANNAISTLEEVRALAAAFSCLEVLDLLDNPLDTTSSAGFKAVFSLFPKLTALNSRDVNGDEVVVEESDESENSSTGGEEDEDDEDDEDDEEDDDEDDDDSSGSGTGSSDDGDTTASSSGASEGGDSDRPEQKRRRTQ